jgi:phosphoribosylaminoimidazole-succinocarboxamide synthase
MAISRPIREYLQEFKLANDRASFDKHAYGGLTPAQKRTLGTKDINVYTGKVRDVVTRGDELLVVHSDRLTAFDRLIAHVPYKGTMLTAISEFWLDEAKRVVPTHLIGRPHERVLKVERATPFKVEVIVRGYLAGSMARAYANGERDFCGVKLPAGLRDYGPLPTAIITPTTKAAAFEHDENTTPAALVSAGIVSKAEWDEISTMALKLFAHGQKVYRSVGWILVDTKYEFGRTTDGQIKVIDEIHTPDSSRLWIADTYESRVQRGTAPEMLDKEVVRRYLLDQGFSGHGDVPPVPVDRLVELAEVYLRVAETLVKRPLMTEGPISTLPIEALL